MNMSFEKDRIIKRNQQIASEIKRESQILLERKIKSIAEKKKIMKNCIEKAKQIKTPKINYEQLKLKKIIELGHRDRTMEENLIKTEQKKMKHLLKMKERMVEKFKSKYETQKLLMSKLYASMEIYKSKALRKCLPTSKFDYRKKYLLSNLQCEEQNNSVFQ